MDESEVKEIQTSIGQLGTALHGLKHDLELLKAAEVGYRALQAQQVETLKLTMQHASITATNEIGARYEVRISKLEQTVATDTEHRRDRIQSFYALRNALIVLGVTQLIQLLIMLGYLVSKGT